LSLQFNFTARQPTSINGYCRGIVNSQLSQIDAMRELLCDRYQICDYQPLVGVKGRHTGNRNELDFRFRKYDFLTSVQEAEESRIEADKKDNKKEDK